ncbi:PREDICTED: calmodulin-binding transcription activator 2-like, partial [Thamnophis sirtalis]|uniref:Calmodulin-binding transcription activator 2-like n=1 Tax=Thamnophis sirtalis TaxID=35019 RepID=A0A6I9Z234_9SAUR
MNKAATEVSENSHHLKVFLPKKLVESVPKCPALPKERLRWNTNEEIASYLITFEKHEEWLSGSPKTRPQNGSLILYNRKKVKYRKDGYCWKKRKDGKTTREDHMKLKVKGVECLYGCYVHSSIVPTFHRRCYWLLQNPDIVLVHYLNVPAIEDCGKICSPILCSINSDRKEWLKWSKEDLVGQLKPMCKEGRGGTGTATTAGALRLTGRFHEGPTLPSLSDSRAASDSFEERIVAVCEKMMLSQSWLRSETLVHHVSFRGMTLLHLAAAQGYTRLIETLIKWRSLNAQNLDLEQEVDPLNVDHFSCTPLMWACALGHLEAAQLLYRWNSQALAIPDSLGRLPLTVARSRGHVKLATCLEELQHQDEALPEHLEPSADVPGSAGKACVVGLQHPTEGLHVPSPLSASPDTGLSTASGVSSPSERSEGSLSVTSAYSSGSALRESPAYSPEAEGAMDVCQGLPPGSLEGWYLPEATSPPGLPPASFFLNYGEGATMGPLRGPEAQLEPELLAYGENAENEEQLPETDVLQVDVMTLAKQIIEATPERIKQEDFGCAEAPLRERPSNMGLNETMSWLASYLENVDQLPSLPQRRGLAPSPPGRSCLSPLQSPLAELSLERLPPPPTAASWAEFLNASGNGKMESDFALLTLSDHEQRELYEAARIIQTAFRKYKGRRLKEQQELAAAVIQRCYRKYKQLTWIALKYALYKKMTQAAILIQSKFRSYYEQKKFRQSRRAAVLIQQYYRSYKEYERLKQGHRTSAAMQQKM